MTTICWFRRGLRLDDHPALSAAAAGGPVVPLVILDPAEAAARPASAERQALALRPLDEALRRHGSRLVVRRGQPREVLRDLIAETGATVVHTTAGFPSASDDDPAAAVQACGAELRVHPPGDLAERGSVLTGAGGTFKVFSPFFRALKRVDVAAPIGVPELTAPASWPGSEPLDWSEARASMRHGWDPVARAARPGADAALGSLEEFLDGPVADYPEHRDLPGLAATSGLSDALAVGEISARSVWHRCLPAWRSGAPGVEDFLSELAWREFARDLLHDFPELATRCWRPEWEHFPWEGDSDAAEAWRRGETGVEMVDAGMRELFATGRMHNRVRMIAASYLTKHLLTDWRVGLAWFEQTLTDWDAASNAMNWQWVAGCGPDASPFFRVFNPDTQAKKFDGDGAYRRYWLSPDGAGARLFAEAAPRSWGVDPSAPRPEPLVDLSAGRARALAAYESLRAANS